MVPRSPCAPTRPFARSAAASSPLSRQRRAQQSTDLSGAATEFVRHRSPQLLIAAFPAALVARAWRGPVGPLDALMAALLIAAQPFTEWLIHVYVLHVRPVGPVTRLLDRAAGRGHRRHHEAPADLAWQFIRPGVIAGGLLLAAADLAMSPAAGTVAVTALGLALGYEWIHFLIHTGVPARNLMYRRLHRHHRLHHYRNESYWLGVTGRLGDRVLGTLPERDEVPVSVTARTALAGLGPDRQS